MLGSCCVFGVGRSPVKHLLPFAFKLPSGPRLLYPLAEGVEGTIYW